jgi:hypothetical protein
VTRRALAALPAVLAATTLASCGGAGGSLRATLGDAACTLDGDTTAQAGRFSIEIENETLRFASFGLVELFGDTTVADIELFHERVTSRQLLRSRSRSDVPPPYGSWVAGADVEPSARTSLPVDTDAGRYAVLCYVHRNTDERRASDEILPPERAFVAGQLEVTGVPTYP